MERKYARNAQKRTIPPLAYQGSNAGVNNFGGEKKKKAFIKQRKGRD